MMSYPQAVNLPFNSSVISNCYRPVKPGDDDPGHPGYWIVIQQENLIFQNREGIMSLHHGPPPQGLATGNEKGLLIGNWKGEPLRLLWVDKDAALPSEFCAQPLLMLFFREELSDELLTIAGLAQQMALWEKSSNSCPRCGMKTGRIIGTWGKTCAACGCEHFPGIYPCVVVLVERGESILMVRKREWPEGYYSLPSGFCDLGECLEECAIREVMEETGIRITDLRYRGSQSWPFPSQLMTAFTARYDSGPILVDESELEDAGWFHKDRMPPTFSVKSIAGWLIDRYRRGTGQP